MIAYDIEDDGARRRIHNVLKDYGKRVQYSVFECWLDEPNLNGLRRQIDAQLDSGDSVRWYPLCAWCRREVSWQGIGDAADDADFYLV